ncbi:unnamed protein product [Microthlaspi erraticum]|uniref:Bifunctional inhibitor/plant lipid transfer protein/seed storage helical domain-containing protein n=1 Tax=Microthlaspi erraticum TaxID=1685480 RepID=A0A6D2KF24_9BRAS|nr:unnamed protein product [Microthlaspi erraticum]
MKFATFILIALIIISTSSPDFARATTLGGFGEVAQVCDPTKLLPCLRAIQKGEAPSKDCCTGLAMVAQEPDPDHSVPSPNARNDCTKPTPGGCN